MAQPGAGVEVFVFKGSRFLGSRCFSKIPIVIGRSSGATLKLKDPEVSDRHAIVSIEGGNIVVADNNSDSGVYVNGSRIDTRTVNSFDEIGIGPFRVKLTLLGEADDGFGSEDSAADQDATKIRRVGSPSPGRPASAGSYESYHEPDGAPAPAMGGLEGETRVEAPGSRAKRARSPEPPTAVEGMRKFDDFTDEAPTPHHDPRTSQALRQSLDHRAKAADATLDVPEQDEWAQTQNRRDPRTPRPELDEPAPAPARAAADGDEEDDDDDENFVEPFSLLENVVRERFKAPADLETYTMTEVIRYKDGQILDLMRADPGQSVRIDPDDFRLVNVSSDGRAQLFFKKGFSGTVVSGGKPRQVKRLRSEKYLVYPKKKIYGVELSEGDYAQLIREEGGYLVRFVRPPKPPRPPRFGFTFSWSSAQIFAGSAAFHFLILVMLGFVAPEANLRVVTDAERFAKITVKDLKLEKPKEPEPEPEPEPAPKQDEPQPKPKKQAKPIKRAKRKAPPSPQVAAKQKQEVQQKQVKNVLSALQNLKPKSGPGRTDLKALASNIAAVRVPGGTASDFRVSGVIKKIPGGGVRLGGTGGGGSDTKVGSQLLRGTNIGKLQASAGTGTRVRGRVRKAPTRAISASGGHLSREAIQKVVSQHMHEVQACYERQLIRSPGLSGKVVFDWQITVSGGVGLARQVSSSMQNPMVSTCILGLIRSWKFPQPVGGSVQVRYPFVFRVQGF